jgi:hypothetical protein
MSMAMHMVIAMVTLMATVTLTRLAPAPPNTVSAMLMPMPSSSCHLLLQRGQGWQAMLQGCVAQQLQWVVKRAEQWWSTASR